MGRHGGRDSERAGARDAGGEPWARYGFTVVRQEGNWVMLEGQGRDAGKWIVKGPSSKADTFGSRRDADQFFSWQVKGF